MAVVRINCFYFAYIFVNIGILFGAENVPIGVLFEEIHTRPSTNHSDWFNVHEANSALAYKVQKTNLEDGNQLQLHTTIYHADMLNSYKVMSKVCQLKEHNIVLLGTTVRTTADVISSWSDTYHFPFISIGLANDRTKEYWQSDYTIYMRPLYTKPLFDIIKMKKWKKIIYLFNSEEGLYRMQQLFAIITSEDYSIDNDFHQATSVESAKKYIDSLSHGDYNIVLDMSMMDTDKLLRQQIHSPRNVNFEWLLVTLGMSEVDFRALDEAGLKFTTLSIIDNNNPEVKKALKGWQKDIGRISITAEEGFIFDSVTLIHKAFDNLLNKHPRILEQFKTNGSGINCASDTTVFRFGLDIFTELKMIKFEGVTGPVAFDDNGLREKYSLQILQSGTHRKTITWTEGIEFTEKPATGYQPPPVKTEYKVTTIFAEPFLMLREGGQGKYHGNERFEGYCADLIEVICKQLDIKCVIELVKDGRYGSNRYNGTWNGMIGELIRREADLAVAPLTITTQREEVIDFSKAFMYYGIAIIMSKDSINAYTTSSVWVVFSMEVYLCIFGAFVGVAAVMFFISRVSPYERSHEDEHHCIPTPVGMDSCTSPLWFTVGAFLNQRCTPQPKSISGRIAASVSWFFAIVFICMFISQLMRIRTVESLGMKPIRNAYDLSRQTKVKYGTIAGGSTMQFFQTSNIPTYEHMWAFMSTVQPSVFVSTTSEGFERVRKSGGSYVFMTGSPVIEYVNQQEPCNTIKVGPNLNQMGYGIATPIGSPLRNRIDLILLMLRENGHLQMLENKWWYGKGSCGTSMKAKGYSFQIQPSNLAGLFYVVLAGLIIAIFFVVLELLYKSCCDSKQKKVSFGEAFRYNIRIALKGKAKNTDQHAILSMNRTGDNEHANKENEEKELEILKG